MVTGRRRVGAQRWIGLVQHQEQVAGASVDERGIRRVGSTRSPAAMAWFATAKAREKDAPVSE